MTTANTGHALRAIALALTGALAVATIIAGVGMALGPLAQAQPEQGTTQPMRQPTINAPEFPSGLQWLNTDRPLTLHELRGKVVLLDFWTYCCINCMHIIPDLTRLEHEFPNELVVIGVHSAKFTAEQDVENIRSAILRYEIEHPVVNDRDMTIWDAYAVRAWPTAVLIAPDGAIAVRRSGEGVYDAFQPAITRLITDARRTGTLDGTPLELRREHESAVRGVLRFPGKVEADEAGGRLFIADSGNNRVIVTTLGGEVLDVAGSGAIGLDDGSFEETTFNHPQGMALHGDVLFVADTENHAIRRLDLRRRTVTTVAGTGHQATLHGEGGIGTEVALNSPWDLYTEGNFTYIAMAGSHQIWRMNLQTHRLEPYAGSGAEGIVDGSLGIAALAQPSGITADGMRLLFADSESSAVRYADLPPSRQVGTIVGAGLFEFGDHDGFAPDVRLQHPLGVVHHAGELFVADTYNNKIKRVNPRSTQTETLLGTGEPGLRDGDPAQFDEPGGISYADGRLFIADTNNHAIRVAPVGGGPVVTLDLHPLERLTPPALPSCPVPQLSLEPQTVAPGEVELALDVEFRPGFKLNEEAPSSVLVRVAGDGLALPGGAAEMTVEDPAFPLRVPLIARAGSGEVTLALTLYYCASAADAACYFDETELTAPVTVAEGAGSRVIHVRHALPGRVAAE